jgi:uncharacterized protein with von Willebrand factor type A (vWA) domain
MYPFGSVPENLIAFCGVLRREHGFRIGPGETHDAARALEIVTLADERAVRNALRSILSKTVQDVRRFDRLFDEFFFPGPAGVSQPTLPSIDRELAGDRGDEWSSAGGELADSSVTDREHDASSRAAIHSSYSQHPSDAAGSRPALNAASPEWRQAARALVRHLEIGLSRRWRPGTTGHRFDLRRTLRVSLQTGGETLTPRWLHRPHRTPRFVVLVDGSRSMGASADTALQMAIAIASATMRVEVFTFSTALQRVTREVRRAAAGKAHRLRPIPHSWAGGTAIGICLRAFLRQCGERMVTRETVVIIASDGLDVGAIDTLRNAMRALHRLAAGVVWINPLIDTRGYEPTASGMRVARPYVSTFVNVEDASGLRQLSRSIRIRS